MTIDPVTIPADETTDACCEFHDANDSPCAPDDRGYCCDDCPTLQCDSDRERTLATQNVADAEWDRAQRTGVTSHAKCPDCGHRIFDHDNAGCCEAVRCCQDCDCDRYARVF